MTDARGIIIEEEFTTQDSSGNVPEKEGKPFQEMLVGPVFLEDIPPLDLVPNLDLVPQ